MHIHNHVIRHLLDPRLQSGGWYSRWSDSKGFLLAGKPYLDKGFTMFIVRHGSAPKYNIPEATEDVRRSVRFVRLKAKEFGVDPERLGVMGGSAGGHLSLMRMHAVDKPMPLSKVLPDAHPKLEVAVVSAMRKEPAERPTAAQLGSMLRELMVEMRGPNRYRRGSDAYHA